MSDTLTPAEIEAIASYTGPVNRVERGTSGIPGIVWCPKEGKLIQSRQRNTKTGRIVAKRRAKSISAIDQRVSEILPILANGEAKTKAQIAAEIDTTPRHLNRAMAYLVQEGIITHTRKASMTFYRISKEAKA